MAYFIVDHVSDENKKDGIVESYQMVNVEVENGDGSTVVVPKRMNFVHWPNIPTPFVHEEWSESLVFTNVYTPETDKGEDGDDEEWTLADEIAEILENDYPEIYQTVYAEAEANLDYTDDEGEEFETEEDDQQTHA